MRPSKDRHGVFIFLAIYGAFGGAIALLPWSPWILGTTKNYMVLGAAELCAALVGALPGGLMWAIYRARRKRAARGFEVVERGHRRLR